MKGLVSNQTDFFDLMTVLLGRLLLNCFNCGKLYLIHCSKYESLRLCEWNAVLILALYTCKLVFIKQDYVQLSCNKRWQLGGGKEQASWIGGWIGGVSTRAEGQRGQVAFHRPWELIRAAGCLSGVRHVLCVCTLWSSTVSGVLL